MPIIALPEIWSTKYALTQGIEHFVVGQPLHALQNDMLVIDITHTTFPNPIVCTLTYLNETGQRRSMRFKKFDFYTKRADALARALLLQQRKLVALDELKATYAALRFE